MNRTHLPPPKSRLLSVAILFLFAIFLVWILVVLFPILWVELSYQTRSAMTNVFGTSDIRELILPNFRVNLAVSKYPTAGITIPSLYINEPIIFNVDPNDERAYTKALTQGIAHASGTGFPGEGKLGYYFAHSSSPAFVSRYNAIFYLLNKIENGDTISIWHNNSRFDYTVFAKRTTYATDVSFLRETYDGDTIVLQTCWPPGTTLERLLVFAKAKEQTTEKE